MKSNAALSWLAGSLILGCPLFVVPARGQITPDTTLGTLVNGVTTGCNAATCTITGGATNGNNLFHSFSEFSLLTGNQAFFDNAIAIDNIFARVTGTSISNIDGIISANGTANLFLLNPNGIIFGSNAQLNVGGSFLATTAEEVVFSDGVFSATNPGNSVLSMNVPLGVQFGSALGSITNRSQATNNDGQTVGLAVPSGKTLALLGGALNLEGGYVTAPQGTIELGSVGDNSLVNLTLNGDNLSLDYAGVENFQDINLSQQAVVSTSGGSDINIQARQLRVTQGSQISANTDSSNPAGNVQVNTTELVEITGSALDINNNIVFSTLSARSNRDGNAGNVNINTKKLSIRDGGDVSVSSLLVGGPGIPGNITVNASETVELDGVGFNGFNPSQFSRSGLFAANSGIGDAGNSNITVNTPQLTILNGARISTSTRGPEQDSVSAGDGGNVIVNAQSIELSGVFISGDGQTFNSGLFAQSGEQLSGIFTPGGTPLNAQDAAGNGGNISVINAEQLIVRDGAEISTTSFGSGNGGDIFVNSDTVEVSGSALNSQGRLEFSTISARARGNGNSGDININTRQLVTRDGADVSVSLLGQNNSGIPGNLTVNASESIELLGAATNPNDLNQFSRSGLFAATNGTGDASVSSLTITTPRLIVRDGARVSTATRGGGQNGVPGGRGANLVVNASESIELSGSFTTSDGRVFQSGLFAQSGEELSSLFVGTGAGDANLGGNVASGDGGSLTVNTKLLDIREGAAISVSTTGSGAVGNLDIMAHTLRMDNGFITGTTALGTVGNITIRVKNAILRNNSQISTNGGGVGDGGNITITGKNLDPADFVLLLANSDITSNAFQGNGGRILINVREIFNCSDCDITAASDLGIDGEVELNTPETQLEVFDPSEDFLDPQDLVAQVCETKQGDTENKFIIVGRGGLPTSTSEPLGSDIVAFERPDNTDSTSLEVEQPATQEQLPLPAQGWYVNEQGEVIFTAEVLTHPQKPLSTSADCHS
ncbi:MAG: filamentous hemagglutinin N-terminal domain-containing protein [Symploca sp. SIO3E6]|nr:filamentous hemagglutinin N-terminal domain-containing protein [Caldora sp. SIO3E6]